MAHFSWWLGGYCCWLYVWVVSGFIGLGHLWDSYLLNGFWQWHFMNQSPLNNSWWRVCSFVCVSGLFFFCLHLFWIVRWFFFCRDGWPLYMILVHRGKIWTALGKYYFILVYRYTLVLMWNWMSQISCVVLVNPTQFNVLSYKLFMSFFSVSRGTLRKDTKV